ARHNVSPNDVNNNYINNNGNNNIKMQHTDGSTMNHDGMTMDEEHKNTMCKDGRCRYINKNVETGNGVIKDVNTKTDGT
ncbi:YbgS-like family protein, partial [Salmonella enterica]|uniref:YbgS-like family protein n=1 Tax=Salmonella enterica TaxID=28901 RepID=UPI0020C541AC